MKTQSVALTRVAPSMSVADRLTLFGTLGNMVAVGIPMTRALGSLAEHLSHPGARATVIDLLTGIEKGQPLSAVMAKMPLVFSRLHIGAIRGGERSGRLCAVLTRLREHEARSQALSRKLRSVLTYPCFVMACALVLVAALGRSLLTGMAPMLLDAHVKLTPLTRATITCAQALEHPGALLALLLCCGAGVGFGLRWLRSERGRVISDRVMFRLPVVGPLMRRVETAAICETLTLLHGSGLSLSSSLEMAADTSESTVTREALLQAQHDIAEGHSFSEALAQTGFFDRTVVQMIAVGEETGHLEKSFVKIAQLNSLEVEAALEQFGAAIEPLMFALLGGVVGVIALIAFAPLYSVLETAL